MTAGRERLIEREEIKEMIGRDSIDKPHSFLPD